MGNKRRPSAHQRQMVFFTVMFATLCIALLVAFLWFLNRAPGGRP